MTFDPHPDLTFMQTVGAGISDGLSAEELGIVIRRMVGGLACRDSRFREAYEEAIAGR